MNCWCSIATRTPWSSRHERRARPPRASTHRSAQHQGTPVTTAPAPVALFCYMRPEHLARTLDALQRNPEATSTHLRVYCDAARKPEHQAAVDAVRRLADDITGFASVTRIHRASNLGLARSIIDGVSTTLQEYDRVIVLEDDLVLSPHFLAYMNAALDCYAHDAQVASIHGYCYPVPQPLPETFFLQGADCWGWATWSRAWAGFEPDGERLLAQLTQRALVRAFDLDGSYPYTAMLRGQIAGRNDSWAIRWHASCFLHGMLTLYPGRSLVVNIGNDASGTHCGPTEVYTGTLDPRPVPVARIALEPSPVARAAFVDFFRRTRESLVRRAWRRVLRPLRGNR